MTSAEDIVSGMEYQKFAAIKGRPNYENINTIRRKMYANMASVDSLWGDAHGHLGQVMTPATYLPVTAIATPYKKPPNPWPQPPQPPALFPQQCDDIKAAHKRSLDEFNTSNNFDKAIK
jgi:hypothetical protein